MATTVALLSSLNFLPESTTAGRRFRTGISEKGKGTTMVSYLSQITKRFLVFRAFPLNKQLGHVDQIVVRKFDLSDRNQLAPPVLIPIVPNFLHATIRTDCFCRSTILAGFHPNPAADNAIRFQIDKLSSGKAFNRSRSCGLSTCLIQMAISEILTCGTIATVLSL